MQGRQQGVLEAAIISAGKHKHGQPCVDTLSTGMRKKPANVGMPTGQACTEQPAGQGKI